MAAQQPLDITRHNAEGLEAVIVNHNSHFRISSFSGEIRGPFKWYDKQCIIKRIRGSQEEVKEFYREISHSRLLSHPHIITALEVLKGKTAIYIVQEQMKISLDKILYPHARAFDTRTSVDCALQIARGLAYLHSKGSSAGYKHYPLRSSRVLVARMRNGVPKILKLQVAIPPSVRRQLLIQSQQLAMRGTMDFAWYSPQVLIGEETSEKANDIWSFGVVLYEIFVQTPPYDDADRFSKFMCDGLNRKRILVLPDVYPKRFKQLLKRCCAVDPYCRPTITQICEQLNQPGWNELVTKKSDFVISLKLTAAGGLEPAVARGIEFASVGNDKKPAKCIIL